MGGMLEMEEILQSLSDAGPFDVQYPNKDVPCDDEWPNKCQYLSCNLPGNQEQKGWPQNSLPRVQHIEGPVHRTPHPPCVSCHLLAMEGAE